MVARPENSHDSRSRSAAAASPLGPVPAGVLRRIRPVARLLSPCEGAAGVVPPPFPLLLLVASSRAREGQRLGRPPGTTRPPSAWQPSGRQALRRHAPPSADLQAPPPTDIRTRSPPFPSLYLRPPIPTSRPTGTNRYAPTCARSVPHRQPTAKPLRLLARPRSSRPRSASRLSHLRNPRRAARARYGPRGTPTVLVAVTASSKGPAARAPLHPSTLPVSVDLRGEARVGGHIISAGGDHPLAFRRGERAPTYLSDCLDGDLLPPEGERGVWGRDYGHGGFEVVRGPVFVVGVAPGHL